MTIKPTSDAVAVTGADRDCMLLDALDFQVGAVARIVGHWAGEWPDFVRIAGIDKSRGKLNITITELDGNGPTDGFGINDLIPQPRHRLASTRPMTEDVAGEQCHDCGGFYQTVYRVPDDVWTKIAPDKAALGEHEEHRYGGLLCLPCADRRAREKGIRLYFDASVGDWRPSDAALLADICDNMPGEE